MKTYLVISFNNKYLKYTTSLRRFVILVTANEGILSEKKEKNAVCSFPYYLRVPFVTMDFHVHIKDQGIKRTFLFLRSQDAS